jgi:predicted nucleic acid-binding protein
MARPPPVVIDASVAVKWFNPEESSGEALALRDDHLKARLMLAAPSLIVFEVVNALRYNEEVGSDDVRQAVGDFIDLQVALVAPDRPWLDRAVQIAFQSGVTIYDASYIALAEHLRARLYTADEKMLKAGGGVALPIAQYEGGAPAGRA